MIVDEEKYEITPIYNSMGYLDEIALDDCENIISAFSMTEIVNADFKIVQDIALYAKWTKTGYTVTYAPNGGSVIPTVANIETVSLATEDSTVLTMAKTIVRPTYKVQIDKLVEEGLLEKDDKGIRLTYKGEDLANIVWQEFI